DVLNKGYPSKAVRYLLLSTHYRQQLNFTFKGLEGAKGALQRLFDFMDKLESINGEKDNPAVQELLSKVRTKFEENLDDDLNISGALGETFDFVREINTFMDDGSISKNNAKMILDQMWEFDKVLGVLEKEELILSEEIKELIQKREDAREKKDWTLADKIRSEIESKGITVEDTSEGPKVKKKI
ncbi:MAG: DALR domain-containing protein, partial [Candidatus Zixiibacteriota bacterium]